MKIKFEKQSSKLHVPGPEDYSTPLRLDPDKYREYLPETCWSEEVQDEWLNTLWNMMSTFVDLGFGIDPVQSVLKTERPSSPKKPAACGPKDFEPTQTSVSH